MIFYNPPKHDPNIYLPDPSFVEYYFHLYVDHEIDDAAVGQAIGRLKSKGIYVDEEINYPDIPFAPIRKDIYGPSGFSDTEVCDTDPPDTIPVATYTQNSNQD